MQGQLVHNVETQRKADRLDEISDQILAQQAQAGDGLAYETLIARHYRRIYAVCLGIVANPHDAQDLCQETMLAGFVKISHLRQPERFQYWLIEVAKNLCFDWLRKQKQARKFIENRPAVSEKPDSAVDLTEAVSKLPMELRMPLVMYYFDGRNARAISEQLGTSPSSISRKLREAKRCLYDLLNEVKS
jgi:RNA polymerase sigma factor (sigma-70 family)